MWPTYPRGLLHCLFTTSLTRETKLRLIIITEPRHLDYFIRIRPTICTLEFSNTIYHSWNFCDFLYNNAMQLYCMLTNLQQSKYGRLFFIHQLP